MKMELNKQIVSLELAQKLKELGVEQESLFYYQAGQIYLRSQHIDPRMLIADNGERTLYMSEFDVSAFTVAELGEMLPAVIKNNYLDCYRVEMKEYTNGKRWECSYGSELGGKFFSADTEADARAKMLIYLLENKLITL